MNMDCCENKDLPLMEETAQSQSTTVPAAQYEALAKAYLRLEQQYAAIILTRSREKALEEELAQTRATLDGVLSSLSWRVTAPIRKLMGFCKRRSHGT